MFAASFAMINDLLAEILNNHLTKQSYEKNPNLFTGW